MFYEGNLGKACKIGCSKVGDLCLRIAYMMAIEPRAQNARSLRLPRSR
jgi:hypothetical protein